MGAGRGTPPRGCRRRPPETLRSSEGLISGVIAQPPPEGKVRALAGRFADGFGHPTSSWSETMPDAGWPTK